MEIVRKAVRITLYNFVLVCIFLIMFGCNNNVTAKGGTITLTTEEFNKKVVNLNGDLQKWVYLGDKPCLIDFYADWCGPCKMIAPVLEELAKTYNGEIYIYKINTEKDPQVAGAFGVQSIPTLLFCPMAGDPQIAKGALPRENLVKVIEEVLLLKSKK